MNRHEKSEIAYTKERLPIKLVTYIAFGDKYKAFEFERYLKSGSGKAFAQKKIHVVYASFRFQTVHWVHQGCFNRLKTYRQKRYYHCPGYRH